nr:MAG TPA: hypothetical protein [Crassvirales sp.]
MPRFSLEDLDNLAEYGETAAAIASLTAGGATLVMPNPVTASIAAGSNILGSAIDLYQTGRSLYKGDYGDAAKNVGEVILGLVGAKAIKQGQKLLETDRTLNASNASRRYVVKSVGRRNKHFLTHTKEYDDGMNKITRGFDYSTASNLSSAFLGKGFNQPLNAAPSDNTRVVRNYRPALSTIKGKIK